MSDDWPPVRRSPDGAIEVTFAPDEPRMSLWVLEPIVRRVRDGRVVLSLETTWWDSFGTAEFPGPNLVAFALRHYPDGQRVVRLVADVEAETYGVGDGAVPDRPIAPGLVDALDEERKRVPPPSH